MSAVGHCCQGSETSDEECAATAFRHCTGWVGTHCTICDEPMWREEGDLVASHVRHDHPEDHVPAAPTPEERETREENGW